MTTNKFLSRGIDYLGDLGAKLRDLQGFATLANELIQNADDVKTGVTKMTFNITNDALMVDNDGVFSDCQQIELDECPWKGEKGYRCDFHRFRYVASGDKRGEEETTGAFGIGFIAVYQVTDQPELISSGRHWILHEDRPEQERIEVCSGCPKCNSAGLPGTRFILPWAKDPKSVLREKLKAQAISDSDIEKLSDELNRFLMPAMLFLKRLQAIELYRNGQVKRVFQRLDEGSSLILTDGNPVNDQVWHLCKGNFAQEAENLRRKYQGRIEHKRSSQVTIAIPQENRCKGLFCATLPTEQETGLPFHINADFFTSNDRKRLNLSAGYEADWNRAAIRAAAKTLAEHFDQLPHLLGHVSLWGLLESIKKISDEARNQDRESSMAAFWEQLSPRLQTMPIVLTTQREWVKPSQCILLQQREEAAAIPVLEKLGMKIASEELRPYQSLLRSEAIGVPVLDIPSVCTVLEAHGFDTPLEPEKWKGLLSDDDLRRLWTELALLRDRIKRTPNVQAEHDKLLRQLAIAPVQGNRLVPCQGAYRADSATVDLFSKIDPEIPFVTDDPDFEPLKDLCQTFDAAVAINLLDAIKPDRIALAWNEGRLDLKKLFEWLDHHRREILEDDHLKQSLTDLAIFPSSGRLQKMASLALPGNFNDPLGLAEIVDLNALGGRREFLHDLGMPALDFKTYVERLPGVLFETDIPADKRRQLISLLAERIGEIRDDQSIRDRLAKTPLVECTDGTFHKATDCYLPNEGVKNLLGESVLTAIIPDSHTDAYRDLYQWLGVEDRPRIPDLLKRIKEIAETPYSGDQIPVITDIISHLGQRFRDEEPALKLEVFQNLSWLPARGKTDRWYKPQELYAVFQDYLFESQALFLDIPRNIQTQVSNFLEYLGVKTTPETKLVVKHLLYSSENDLEVNQEVYRFLDNHADDPALNMLRDKKCLYLKEEKRYVSADQVFWGDHPFGRYRHRLDESLRKYGNLLKKLGVREGPDHTDAIAVIEEIAASYEATKQPLDEHDQAVILACWQLLETAIDTNGFTEKEARPLQKIKCVPNAKRMLNPPEWMFFENRAGLAEKFGSFLRDNVIPKPMGAGRAMTMAGVRPLGSAVQVQLLECDDPIQDIAMANRIHERRNALARILDSQIPSDAVPAALQRLNQIRFESARALTIRYQLHAFKKVLESEPESTPALYLSNENRLIVVNTSSQPPWPAIARELSVAMLPEDDPGRIAAGVKEVLSAETVDQANQTLDELGFPKLDTELPVIPEASNIISGLGTEEIDRGEICPAEAIGSSPKPKDDSPISPRQAIEAILGPNAPQPSPSPVDTPPEPPMRPPTGQKQKQRGDIQRNKRPVLRSYIPSPYAWQEANDGTAEAAARSEIDQIGIDRVLDYERACGRIPEVMPHTHPGYDIESRDAEGRVLRYIEVKALSGHWIDTYAVLSKLQFEEAKRLGEKFWLYVVEQARTDTFTIHRIQNPAGKANHFMFDDGWRAIAELEEESEKLKE